MTGASMDDLPRVVIGKRPPCSGCTARDVQLSATRAVALSIARDRDVAREVAVALADQIDTDRRRRRRRWAIEVACSLLTIAAVAALAVLA